MFNDPLPIGRATQPPWRIPAPPTDLNAQSIVIRELCITAYLQYQQRRGMELPRYPPRRLAVDDGLEPPPGRRDVETPVWIALARFIEEHRLNPLAFIRAQYSSYDAEAPIATNKFMSEGALKNYRKFLEEGIKRCALELSLQKQVLEMELYSKKMTGYGDNALAAVLADISVSLSALFRYCVACASGLREQAEDFETAAGLQYLEEPYSYDVSWGPVLPIFLPGRGSPLPPLPPRK